MSEWAPKRFWKEAGVEQRTDGFQIALDGRPVRTPAKQVLMVPTHGFAQKIADEWQAQTEAVDPSTMPWTRSANAAIDKVATQRSEVEAHLISYAMTDLLCYRADGPESLVQRQIQAWDPVLDWAEATYGVRLNVTSGVMPVEQDDSIATKLRTPMTQMNDFQLTGFHDLVTISGSYLLGLQSTLSDTDAAAVWAHSRVDEDWQSEQWGVDEEAAEAAEVKKSAFLHAREIFLESRIYGSNSD